jgi:hypothetical protein
MKEATVAIVGLSILLLLAVNAYHNYRRFHKPLITTPYQSVMLVNGSVVYGMIDHLGTDYPVLRDAFTVQHEFDENTRQQRYILLNRKDDINGADHMILPATSIVFVEPVKPDSTVGMLITQASSEK